MPKTAAHLVDHVIPPVPVRQRVISVPERLRWFLSARPAFALKRLSLIAGREDKPDRIRYALPRHNHG